MGFSYEDAERRLIIGGDLAKMDKDLEEGENNYHMVIELIIQYRVAQQPNSGHDKH